MTIFHVDIRSAVFSVVRPIICLFSGKISAQRGNRPLFTAYLKKLIMSRLLAAITLLLSIILTILVTIACSVPIIIAGIIKLLLPVPGCGEPCLHFVIS
jgi:hypothetical protein